MMEGSTTPAASIQCCKGVYPDKRLNGVPCERTMGLKYVARSVFVDRALLFWPTAYGRRLEAGLYGSQRNV